MFKRLRFAFLLLPILSVGALAGCSAQVGTGAPEESSNQTEQLGAAPVNVSPSLVSPTNVAATSIPVPADLGQHHTKPQLPVAVPVDPDQVENGTPTEPDPSPWVENPGGTDPDPSPWMQSTSSQQSQAK